MCDSRAIPLQGHMGAACRCMGLGQWTKGLVNSKQQMPLAPWGQHMCLCTSPAHLLPQLGVFDGHVLPKAASMVHDRLVLALHTRLRCGFGGSCCHEGVHMSACSCRCVVSAVTQELLSCWVHGAQLSSDLSRFTSYFKLD